MKNRAQGGIGGSSGRASNDASVEATPLPPRRDIVKTINFTAPVQIGGTHPINNYACTCISSDRTRGGVMNVAVSLFEQCDV